MSNPKDAKHQPLTEVDKLKQDAARARELRALHTNPDVVALRTEKVRTQVDRLMWTGLLLGLAFTMVNVQTFAADGAAPGTLPWLAAWLLDPMVSLVLVAVLRAEQVTARYQVAMHDPAAGLKPWVRRTKVFAFLATYVMNTWVSWQAMDPAGIVLHSVPPVAVYLAAETGPILRDRLTEAVLRAERLNTPATTTVDPTAGVVNGSLPVQDEPTPAATPTPARRSRPAAKRTTKARTKKPLTEYLAEARAAYRPGVVVSPAWVRSVAPDISRGSSQNVSDALKRELADHSDLFPASTVDQHERAAA